MVITSYYEYVCGKINSVDIFGLFGAIYVYYVKKLIKELINKSIRIGTFVILEETAFIFILYIRNGFSI
jgi:fluoride ion exporter CrcB/FEX